MKKFLSAIVFTLFVVFACNTADVSAATIGSGTKADPYISIDHKTVELGETWSVKNFAYLGKQISVKDGEKTIFGTVEDVSPAGTLLLSTANGPEEIYIGDLIV